ncbi:hypothetical protein FOFC_19071 [Fusarium oxysporum]|nr:hypothetical protein FOFC_19071 [Fusarium oxysporum]
MDHAKGVKGTLVNSVEAARLDVIQSEERILGCYFINRQHLSPSTAVSLKLLIFLKNGSKLRSIREIQIAEVADRDIRDAVVILTLEVLSKVFDKFGSILSNLDIDLGRKLLTHAVVAGLSCRVGKRWVFLDNENFALEVRVRHEKPGNC